MSLLILWLWAAMAFPAGVDGAGSPEGPSHPGDLVSGQGLGREPVAAASSESEDLPSRPIRTNEPGTGVFIGSGLLGRVLFDRRSNARETLETWTAVADFRHTPATHWVFGIRVPFVLDRRLESPAVGETSAAGLGDVSVGVKHRFFRRVGRWSDRHAAVEVDLELPTGVDDAEVDPGLPIQRRRQLQPGSGSVDLVADLIYQEGRQRFVYGGDLSFRLATEGREEYRFGNEVRLNLDAEYILFPLEYRRPGNEVFVLLETTLARKWADEADGGPIPTTARTELLLAPALQYIATERLLFSLSVQFPAVSETGDPEEGTGPDATPTFVAGLEPALNVLAEFRYAF